MVAVSLKKKKEKKEKKKKKKKERKKEEQVHLIEASERSKKLGNKIIVKS